VDDRNKPYDLEPRRLRLDQLFEDAPYLSPTMKARCLHERLAQMQAQGMAAEVVVQEPFGEEDAFADALLDDLRRPHTVPTPASVERPAPEAMLTLAEVVQYLRVMRAVPHLDRLCRFRDQVLKRWLEEAPRREA